MIKFTYAPSAEIQGLIQSTIVDVEDPARIPGYVDETNSIGLQHCSMFLVCDTIYPKGQMPVYSNPYAIIAKNDRTAMEIFNQMTQLKNGSVMSILETRCDNVKVTPV